MSSRAVKGIVGLVLVGAGYFCLNYTSAFGGKHHADWATQHGLPAPSYPIFIAGAALVALGAASIGHALGKAVPAP